MPFISFFNLSFTWKSYTVNYKVLTGIAKCRLIL